MKRTLASFLILLVVAAPALACCCPDEVQKSAHAEHQVVDHDGHHSDEHSGHDCARADFQVSSQITTVQPSDPKTKLQLGGMVISHTQSVLFVLNENRAPLPFFAAHPPDTVLPVFLTTQRLRI